MNYCWYIVLVLGYILGTGDLCSVCWGVKYAYVVLLDITVYALIDVSPPHLIVSKRYVLLYLLSVK